MIEVEHWFAMLVLWRIGFGGKTKKPCAGRTCTGLGMKLKRDDLRRSVSHFTVVIYM